MSVVLQKRLAFIGCALLILGADLSCAKARHVAVQMDASVVSMLGVIDDVQFEACQTHVIITVAQCEATDPKIKQALIDARAVTQALKDTPRDTLPPTSLAALLKNLTTIQTIFSDLPPGLFKSSLVAQIAQAIEKVIAVLAQFTTP